MALCLQRGNPILKFVRSVPWEFGEVAPDYVLGLTTCALFLRLLFFLSFYTVQEGKVGGVRHRMCCFIQCEQGSLTGERSGLYSIKQQ